MGLRERIREYIDYLSITVQEFETSVGLSNGAVSKMGDNTRRSTLDKISISYPELNETWLLTGEGAMLRSGRSPNEEPPKGTFEEERYRRLCETVSYALTACGGLDRVLPFLDVTKTQLMQYTNAGADAATRAVVETSLDTLFDAFPEISPFRVLCGNPEELSEVTVKRPVPATRKADTDVRVLENRLSSAQLQIKELFDMLKEKDNQIREKDEQMRTILDLLNAGK